MRNHPRPDGAGRQQGFVLAVVLWILVAIAVVVGLVLYWTRERLDEAQRSRDEVDAQIAALSTRETLLFVASTVPSTIAGLPVEPMGADELALRRLDEFGGFDRSPRGGEIRLDGTLYAGLGDVTFALQDESGLIPVALPEVSPLPALLSGLGVPVGAQARLVDVAADYVDVDAVRRTHGAEARDYERQGLPAPPGRAILHSREFARLPYWRAMAPDARARFFDWTTTSYSGALNLNTAPSALLAAVLPGCREICRARLERRGDSVFLSGRQFEEETAVRLPGDRDVDYRTAPSEGMRMSFMASTGRVWRIHVRLTPLADRAAPWTVDAAYRSPRPSTNEPPRTIPSPLFTAPPMAGG